MRQLAGFVLVFVLLDTGAVIRAEFTVGRAGEETGFQRLLDARGESCDWVILGASHALPLAYGAVAERLEADIATRAPSSSPILARAPCSIASSSIRRWRISTREIFLYR